VGIKKSFTLAANQDAFLAYATVRSSMRMCLLPVLKSDCHDFVLLLLATDQLVPKTF